MAYTQQFVWHSDMSKGFRRALKKRGRSRGPEAVASYAFVLAREFRGHRNAMSAVKELLAATPKEKTRQRGFLGHVLGLLRREVVFEDEVRSIRIAL